jgi:NAD(P)-dependent dehydrogenase (short-subunit alcohol dehydrogenase family)
MVLRTMSSDEPWVVVVTGGSAGVGRATARAFAELGARVAVLARGSDGLQATCRDIEALGGQALALPTDVAYEDEVERAAAAVVERWGCIDIWVNNAMATIFGPAQQLSGADFRRATEVTYLGAVWGTRVALKRMHPQRGGVIVQVGSALAYRSIPLQAPYCAAKAALRGFTDSLRSELLHDGSAVQLTMVHLSAFNTPQFEWGRTLMPRRPQPVPPIFQPELAAQAIVWAATHERREWWVGWPAVKAILGQRVVPGLLDRILARKAYDGQQDDEPLPEGRQDNLHQPVAGDHGARGRFNDRSRDGSLHWWWITHGGVLLAAVLALLIACVVWIGWIRPG